MSGRELANDLWVRGAGHLIGAQALRELSQDYAEQNDIDDVERFVFNGKFSASLHLLIGYSMELLLKSAYVLHGGEPNQLKQRALGHDLEATLTAAESLGFETSAPNLRWVVERLSQPHLQHQFRYGGAEYLHMPELQLTFGALDHLVRELRARLTAN